MIFKELFLGFKNTILIFFITLFISLPLGIVVYYLKKSKNRVIRIIFSVFISVMRGTPLMLQLMFTYFAPYYLFNLKSPDRFLAVILTFSLNYSAYFAEIFRGGFSSIDNGQYDAAKIIGLSKWKTFKKIIFPQVLKIVLPSITNEVITLVKDTSLAMVIAVSETFTVAKAMAARESSMIPYVAVAVFYYIANYLVAFIMELLEKRYE
ncbi:MAG: amino acid ABC transporter permease [Peptoniphilaceae bacterium]|nr:amino acid ABC transporter permease [Peptoniphilaceae bacterium]MDD7383561.1 amino acid ABC transporter permease [Peptoniphilaceae bacterium]MDY3738734.1 amino acid ABC transporter permease [Peptoniphilaceae bacterium]